MFGEAYKVEDAVRYLWNIQPMIPHRPNLYELISSEYDLPPRARENLAAYIRESPTEPQRTQISTLATHLLSEILKNKSFKELKAHFSDIEFLDHPSFPELMKKIVSIGKSAMVGIKGSDQSLGIGY